MNLTNSSLYRGKKLILDQRGLVLLLINTEATADKSLSQ